MVGKVLVSVVAAVTVFSSFDVNFETLVERAKPQQQTEQDLPDEVTDTSEALLIDGRPVQLGDSLDTVLSRFGEADDMLASEYGFTWYVFLNEYRDYLQVGMQEDKVVALYTNSPRFSFQGIRMGSTLDDVRVTYGDSLEKIRKGNVYYVQNQGIDGKRERDLFLYKEQYVTVFYDLHRDTTVTSIQIIDKEVEQSLLGFYGPPSDALKHSFEQQNFYAANAVRVREGLEPYEYNALIAEVAEGHSRDMAENDYFAHDTPDGKTVMDRALEGGIQPSRVAENIAYGGQNGIVMHELLMNSEGHRKNLLGDYERMGVGVWFDSEGVPYLTQNFYTPPRINVG